MKAPSLRRYTPTGLLKIEDHMWRRCGGLVAADMRL
jgi:hypothetical protein